MASDSNMVLVFVLEIHGKILHSAAPNTKMVGASKCNQKFRVYHKILHTTLNGSEVRSHVLLLDLAGLVLGSTTSPTHVSHCTYHELWSTHRLQLQIRAAFTYLRKPMCWTVNREAEVQRGSGFPKQCQCTISFLMYTPAAALFPRSRATTSAHQVRAYNEMINGEELHSCS